MTEIKFDSLDFAVFAKAMPSDYPEGRYSSTVTAMNGQTADKSGRFTLRFEVKIAVDNVVGKPRLLLTDYVALATKDRGFIWAGANVFCDIVEIAGHDRDEAYALCTRLFNGFVAADQRAVSEAWSEIVALAKTVPGSRVAPYIVWKNVGDDDEAVWYANVRGTKTCPSYISAVNEVDPAASFTGDDVDSPIETPRRGRTLVQPKRK